MVIPPQTIIMDFEQLIGLTAGICTSSSIIPQMVTTIKKKEWSNYPWSCFWSLCSATHFGYIMDFQNPTFLL